MKFSMFGIAIAVLFLSGCVAFIDMTGCKGPNCGNITSGEDAKLSQQETEQINNMQIIKIQQWTALIGAPYPVELQDNYLNQPADSIARLSPRNYPKGISVCVHAGLVCQPKLSAYYSSVLQNKYGFSLAKDAPSADAVFYIDASIYYGVGFPDLAQSIEVGITTLGMTLGDNNDKLEISGLPLFEIPNETSGKTVTANLTVIDVQNSEPFAGTGRVKRGAGALWYKKGSKNPRYSLAGMYTHGRVRACDAGFKMFLESIDELLRRSVEAYNSKNG